MKKLAFFLGKGGVGKTTLSSAVAYRLSASGQRVLICSLDPAHNLGDVFHTVLSNTLTPIRENLDGMEIDMALWIQKYLEESRSEIQNAYRYNTVIDLNRYLDIMKYSPGTEEYAVLWAIEHIYKTYKEAYDRIIFDTPPTALTLRFLAMPAISGLWIQELSKLRKTLLEKRRVLLKLNPEAAVLGGQVKKEEDPIYQKLGTIHRRLEHLQELFSKESYISVVLNPDELSFSESLRIRDELVKLDVPISSLCYNKFLIDDSRGERLRSTFKTVPIFTFNWLEEGILVLDDLAKLEVSPLVHHMRSN